MIYDPRAIDIAELLVSRPGGIGRVKSNYTQIASACYEMTGAGEYIPSRWESRPIKPIATNCVNCGAPTFPTDSQCSYCLTVHGR